MRKKSLLVLVLFLLSCGMYAQSTLTLADGDPTLLYNRCSYLPIRGQNMDVNQHNQVLYPGEYMSAMLNGKITKITFYSQEPSVSWGGITGVVKVMHTPIIPIPSGGIDATSATEIYTGTIAVVDHLLTFTFSTPFTYTGGNLLVDITAYSKGIWEYAEFYGMTISTPMGCNDGWPIYFYTKATFEYYPTTVNVYTISATDGAGGSITPSGNILKGEYQSQRFDFIPDANHIISSVLIDGVADAGALADSYYVFNNITANHTIHVDFEPVTGTYYTIAASANEGGSITPSGNVAVPEHQNKKFEFFTDEDYLLSKVWIDYVENPQAVNDGYYIFTDVTANHTISAEFFPLGGTIVIADDTKINATVPVSSAYMQCSQHVQMLYSADLIEDLVGKNITKVFYHASTAEEQFGGAVGTIKIMHTTEDFLTDGFINTDMATEVYSGTITLSESLMKFPFTTPYPYTGGNLLIDVTTVAPPGEPRNIIYYGTFTYHQSRFSFYFDGVYYNQIHPFTPKTTFTYTDVEFDTYTIVASAGSGGTINPSGTISVIEAQNKRFDFYPNTNYTLSKVLVDNVENAQAVSDGYYIFTNVTENHTIHAEFTYSGADPQYTITASASNGGTITPNGNVIVSENGDQRFDFSPNTNYTLSKVLVDNVENAQAVSNGYYIFTNVTANHTIRAEFTYSGSDPHYTITASASNGGTINPNGDVTVIENEDQRFDFYSNTNYTLSKVLVDNIENAQAVSDGYYIFTKVTENHTIHAEFLEKQSVAEESFQSIQVFVQHNSLYVVNKDQIPLKGIEIMDITGRVVYRSSVVTSPINLNLTKGIYMVRLFNTDFVNITKIII